MKNQVIHPELLRVLAELGHGDELLICDAGFPIPQHVERIDLGYRIGAPTFSDVVETVACDIEVEAAVAANETGSDLVAWLTTTLGIDRIDRVSHAELKIRSRSCRGAVRTGEATPYANVILVAGVAF